jgi:tryptophan halogenase
MPRSQSDFGIEGYFVMLVGNQVPYRKKHRSTPQELAAWNAHRAAHLANAKRGIDVKEALYYVRHPGWQWNDEVAR